MENLTCVKKEEYGPVNYFTDYLVNSWHEKTLELINMGKVDPNEMPSILFTSLYRYSRDLIGILSELTNRDKDDVMKDFKGFIGIDIEETNNGSTKEKR